MDQITHRIDGAVGIIELSNPPKQVVSAQMLRELDALTERWELDPHVRAIIITGDPQLGFVKHFSVEELAQGAESLEHARLPPAALLKQLLRGIDGAQRVLDRLPGLRKRLEHKSLQTSFEAMFSMGQVHRLFTRLERMDKAVIAAINGPAMGGACELALACDYRLMARGEHGIGQVEILGGVLPGAGGTQRLSAVVGRGRALEMILNGVLLSADEAERIGLVTRAVEPGELMEAALTLARQLARRSPLAIGYAKRAVRVAASWPIDEGLAFERLAIMLCALSVDARRGAAQYLARVRDGRSPRQIFDEMREHGIMVGGS